MLKKFLFLSLLILASNVTAEGISLMNSVPKLSVSCLHLTKKLMQQSSREAEKLCAYRPDDKESFKQCVYYKQSELLGKKIQAHMGEFNLNECA